MIDTTLKEIAGDSVIELVRFIEEKSNVSEFKIAERLGITVNQVRNLLYKLNNYNLVDSVRKKDKRKGWYIYYWNYNPDVAETVFLNTKKQQIDILRKQLEEETETNFLICPESHLRLDFQTALDYDFKCRECGKVLMEEDNTKTITTLRKRINALESEISPQKVEA